MKRESVLGAVVTAASSLILCGAASAQELLSFPLTLSDSTFWEPTNGPTGPAIEGFSLGNSGAVIAATLAGTYRSTNSGGLWELTGPPASSSAAGPNALFFLGSNGQGVYRSTDDGQHWTQLSGLSPFVRTLVSTPDGSLFAGTAVNELGSPNKGAVYYTHNGGDTWSQVFPRGGVTISDAVQCVAIDSSGHLLFSTERGAVYHSPDTGKNYTMPSNVEATSALEVGPDGTVFAASGRGVFRSTDHGLTWSRINAGLTDTIVCSLAIRSGGEIIAGTPSGLFRSTDMGSAWMLLSAVIKNVCDLLRVSDQGLLAGTGTGTLLSNDSGLTWRSANTGMADDRVTALGIDHRGRLYAGVPGGAHWTEDRGKSWSLSFKGVGAQSPTWFCFKDSLLCFATCSDSGIYRSTDGGNSWSPANAGLPKKSARTVGLATGGALVLGTWGGGVYRSTDNGGTWNYIPTGADTVITAFDRTPAGELLLGSAGAVLRSTDDGLTWLPFRSGLPAARVRGISVGLSGHIFAGLDDGGVFRSTDNGASWSPCNAGFPASGMHVYSMALNREGDLFVGAYEGVYRSTDSGDSWEALNTGPPIQLTLSILIDAEGFAYAGTGGAGVWRSVAPTVVSVHDKGQQISEAALYSNYPNPFNPSTVVSYQLSAVSDVRLVVYDLLGREVAVLVNERKTPGKYEVKFDARGLASGAYFYRLQAGRFIQTRNFLLLR